MERVAKKIIYEDDKIIKCLRCFIISEDLHTYTCEALGTKEIIIVGKAHLVKVCDMTGGGAK